MTSELLNAAILLRRGSWVDPALFERAAREIERLTHRVADLEGAIGLLELDKRSFDGWNSSELRLRKRLDAIAEAAKKGDES